MSKGKLLKALAEGVVASVVAVTGTAIAHTEKPAESNNNYCVVHADICPKVRNAVNWACAIADNNSIGYSFGNVREGEYDCSGLVIAAYRNAGIDVGGATYTGNMLRELTNHGFVAYEYHDNADELMVGDILLLEESHTEMYIGGGQNVGAHKDFDGVRGDSSGDEIDYGAFNEYTHHWEYILRYEPKWSDFCNTPELSDNFYAFIENGGSVLSSGGTMHLEAENGAEQQVWHFVKESAGRYTVSNESISGSYNLYQDDTGSVIFNVSGSETACLTAGADGVQTSDYDSCSDAQRFTIHPVSDPIMVEYDFGGSSCPIIEEHYGEPYRGAFDLVITGFSGWYTEREGGDKVDTSKVTYPYSHTLYAHFDAAPEETSSGHSNGGGRHDGDGREDEQPTIEEKTEVVAIADDVDVQRDDIYHPVRVTEPSVQVVTPATEPVTERTPVRVQSVSLSRTSKTLNTVGGSTGFTLTANVSPSDAEDKHLTFSSSNSGIARVDGNGYVSAVSDGTCYITVTTSDGVSASCEVTVKTAYNKTCGTWSAYSETPVSPSSTVEVESYNTTKQVLDRYRCVYYCTKDLDGNRIYDSKSRYGDYSGRNARYGEWLFAVQLGDPNHDYWDYTPGELSNPIAPGGYLNSNQAGYNGSDQTLYTAKWGTDVILVAIKDTLYKDTPVTMYRYRSITNTPVEYN